MKMLFALLAIFLMFVANLLIVTARRRFRGWLRWLLSGIAYLMLIPILLFSLIALF